MPATNRQDRFRLQLEWGLARAQSSQAAVAVVVDVLSFSTSVCIAVERGMRVYPYAWKGRDAQVFAHRHHAILAVGRREATTEGAPIAPSLSPADLLVCPPVARLVLPSPNGSTIAAALQAAGATVMIGCLRNATATADRLACELDRGHAVLVIAAGEHRAGDGSLRPALEDHLGAGAVLSALVKLGYGPALSPEASAAVAMFQAAESHLLEWMTHCASGRELADRGFGSDVQVAAALDVSRTVPVLTDAGFGSDPG